MFEENKPSYATPTYEESCKVLDTIAERTDDPYEVFVLGKISDFLKELTGAK